MLQVYKSNIGALIKVLRGIPPQDSAAATINGAAIDRLLYESCVLHHTVGAASGTPDSFTVNTKLQHSPDGSAGWEDYVPGAAGSGAAAELNTDDTEAEQDIDLRGAMRYIRAVSVVAFVNGTSPKIEVAATVVLGGAQDIPV